MLKRFGRLSGGLALMVGALTAGAGLTLLPMATSPAGAATITVNTPDDLDIPAVPGNCGEESENPCTLRDALAFAQAQAADETINLTDDTYQVLSAGGQLDVNDSGHTVTITGEDAEGTILQAQCSECPITNRVLEVDNATTDAEISNVTIEDGNPSDGNGGGILNDGILKLSNSVVVQNQAADVGGGIEALSDTSTTLMSDTIENNTQVGGGEAGGGGIYLDGDSSNASSLDITGSTITDNTANGGDGGGINVGGAGNVNTEVTIENSTISDNSSDANGGGLAQDSDSTLTSSDNTIIGNSASTDGGGLFLQGDSTAVDSFTDDTIGDIQEGDGNSAQNGGGVYVNQVDPTFTDVDIVNNSASTDGGGVDLETGTNSFTGGSITNNVVTDFGCGGGVYINNGINNFSGVNISSNQAQDAGDGGGVYVEGGTNTFTTDTVNSNQAIPNESDEGGQGGGFYYDGGTNTFTAGSIDSNDAYDGAGGYLNGGTETFTQADISSNMASESGAGLFIFVTDSEEPTTVTASTISDNTVSVEELGVTSLVGDGGGILAESCEGLFNQIDLTNDTIAGNSAPNEGGGYYSAACPPVEGPIQPQTSTAHAHASQPRQLEETASTDFLFDTFDSNSTGDPNGGGNIELNDGSTTTIANTIVANGITATAPTTNCEIDSEAGASFTSLGYNLIDDSTCGTAGTGDIIGQPAHLGALGDNGGPTSTELPATGSAAIGGVPNAVCTSSGVNSDQRGVARPSGQNGTCTIGAVEVVFSAPPAFNPNGYRMVADEGGIFDFGLNFNGSLAQNHLNAPIVGLANAPGVDGYVMAGADGGVFSLGGANFYGSLGGQVIPSPIAAIAAPPSENGYWLVAQNGKIYNFGAVPPLPALSLPPGAHIVGMASTSDGQGAWMTDQFGDVYAEGDAQYVGGLGGIHIDAPIVGIAAAANGQGYVLAATDGGAFAFGSQNFYGSVPAALPPGQHLVAPVVGIAVTHSGNGYWMVGADGGLFNFGDAPFLGSIYTAIGNHPLNGPIVGIQHLGEAPA